MAHVAQMLTQEPIYKSSIFCFKPILLSAHKLILLIYGDNRSLRCSSCNVYFCVNLIAFLGVYGKTKDTVEAHQELQRMEERDALHPQQLDNGRQYLSPASYTLSKEEKQTMFDCLSSIKVVRIDGPRGGVNWAFFNF